MKTPNFILLIILTLIAAAVSAGQHKLVGTVIDVTDGRTVVLDVQSTKMTIVLQHIEVPEAQQPLHDVVKDHLRKLTVGKTATFRPLQIKYLMTEGQLFVDDMDISQQMLRDGAAWHVPVEMSRQDGGEFAVYRDHESLARAEKRGVWSLPDLKTAWEFRAELAKKKDTAPQAPTSRPVRYTNARSSEAIAAARSIGALVHNYNSETKTGYIATPYLGVSGLPNGRQMVVSIAYMYKQDKQKRRIGTFGISVQSAAEDWQFLRSRNMVVVADGRHISIGKPKRDARQLGDSRRERLTYDVSRNAIDKIVNSHEVYLVTGSYVLVPTYGLQLILFNLLDVAK